MGNLMDYEELYAELQPLEKRMKDMIGTAQKLYKNMVKDTENGDIKDLSKMLTAFEELMDAQASLAASIRTAVDGFVSRAYLRAENLHSRCCRSAGTRA